MPDKQTYLKGSILRVMLSTALSMIPGTLAISGYNVVDSYFVGKLGTLPQAAMGFTFPVVMMVSCIYRGLGGGVMTPVSQLLGGGRNLQAARMITGGVLLLTLFGIAISTLGILLVDPVFHRLGANEFLMPMIRKYMIIWYAGSLSITLGDAGAHLLVSAGSPRLGGLMIMLGLVLNAILDPLFIFGWGIIPGSGIAGAALATITAQFISLALVAAILHWKLHLIARIGEVFPLPRLFWAWGTILRYGIPSILGMILNPAGMAVITWAVAVTGGEIAVAAVSVATRIEAVAFIFPMSLGMSLLPIIGQNFGAKYYDRIDTCRRVSMIFAFLFLVAVSALFCVLAPWFATFFSNDPEVIALMVRCVRITAWGFGFIEVHRYSTFFFTGVGKAKSGAALNILRVVGLMVPFTLVAMYCRSLNGIFFSRLAADVLAGCTGAALARALTRKLMRGTRTVASPR